MNSKDTGSAGRRLVDANLTPAHPDEPVVIDIGVDAALALQSLTGIDHYPAVLALVPNIAHPDDQRRVHEVVVHELTQAGVVGTDGVHPEVEKWLRKLHRPDIELIAHIADLNDNAELTAMLRLSLVRAGNDHVLAVRCDDRVVIQPIFHTGRHLATITAAVLAALGPCPPLGFETMSATFEQFAAVPGEPEQRRRALLGLGATAHTAAVLTKAMDAIRRRGEIVVIEHHDGETARPEFSLAVLDTPLGRIVVTPSLAMDGGRWSTYTRGDDAAVATGIAALIELLPRRSWFDTTRSD
ncbi:ESX secretion-associated protein EspG [Nocardia sp. 2]|uniref:ESX secretion-associated protein EspG n=1 Tax=Nocardia acididurans TaxID=2802282 RepID=A0ABS1MJC6_9NOCA|nr:ESX secretion-associated protein EspG [Nocardia acididurans]MBL1079779.1 ESX secretion-associated protein EspG [Nocardia acididurans]